MSLKQELEQKDCLDALKDIAEDLPNDVHSFYHLVSESAIGQHLCTSSEDYSSFIETGHTPQLKQFVEKLWPSFIQELRKDLTQASQPQVDPT